ncbi:hypothetical protein C7S20_19465 [Christiangramia fulva]|uniref:Uncharacterized protein n=1 Tax=Christiangramia fulva TaxID=2126553 RepID=A0A2R3ZAD9_9FLAO|nr:hypothetical protein [Christiangramia fulva]AVR47255.1 hypothetical protein C7S20_19465 [Christiangramia fulva]
MKECLEGLVGLSKSDCPCYTIDDPAVKESTMGLFLDDLEGIDLEIVQIALKCGEDLVDNFNNLYSKAAFKLETDLQVAIADNYRQKYNPYNGRIGEKKFDKPIAVQPLVGLKLDTKYVEGASIVIKSVDLYFNAAGTITLQVWKNDEHLTDYDETINVVDGKTSHNYTTPLNLPIVENYEKNDYYFVYAPGALQPMNNKYSCGCQGVESVRGNFLKPYGVKGADFDSLSIDNTYAFGISLNAVISCSIDSLLCDFTIDDKFYRMLAIALWYKMGELLIEEFFGSREISFDAFSNREFMDKQRYRFRANCKNSIDWMAENSAIYQSNCFICNPQTRATMGKILT